MKSLTWCGGFFHSSHLNLLREKPFKVMAKPPCIPLLCSYVQIKSRIIKNGQPYSLYDNLYSVFECVLTYSFMNTHKNQYHAVLSDLKKKKKLYD